APRRRAGGQSAHEHAPRANRLERSLTARGEAATHQFGIESAAHSAAQITRRGALAGDHYVPECMGIPLHDDNPTQPFPYVTRAIIAINVVVYLFVQPHSGVDSRLGTSRHT